MSSPLPPPEAPVPVPVPVPPAPAAAAAAPPPRVPKPFSVVWSRMIPGLAITAQVSTENMFNAVYVSISEDGNEETAQCHGQNESVWRTVTFFLCFVLGFFYMKPFTEHRLFHGFVSFSLVVGWLFSVSDYPLKCWISSSHPLSVAQARDVAITRFMITLAVTLLATGLERGEPAVFLNFFDWMETKLPQWIITCWGNANVNAAAGDGNQAAADDDAEDEV